MLEIETVYKISACDGEFIKDKVGEKILQIMKNKFLGAALRFSKRIEQSVEHSELRIASYLWKR